MSARAAVPRFVPPAPPRTPKSAATREQLLTAAGELFVERGYDAVSLNDIADAVGLSKTATYGHFRSKGQLLVEVIRWKLGVNESDPAFPERIADPVEAFATMVSDEGRDIRLLEIDAAAAARHDADVAAGMAELYAERDRAIQDALVLTDDPEARSSVIAALSLGLGAREAVGLDAPDARRWGAAIAPLVVGTTGDAIEP